VAVRLVNEGYMALSSNVLLTTKSELRTLLVKEVLQADTMTLSQKLAELRQHT